MFTTFDLEAFHSMELFKEKEGEVDSHPLRIYLTHREREQTYERLKAGHRMFHESSEAFIKRFIDYNPALVIDIGCRIGLTTDMLHSLVKPKRIIGIDSSHNMLTFARERYRHIEFIQHDISGVPFPSEPAQVIYARFALRDVKNPVTVLQRWMKTLAEGGLLLCEEDEWSGTNHSTLHEYHEIQNELASFYGSQLYVGKALKNLDNVVTYSVVSNETHKITPPIEQCIELFLRNLYVWRNDQYILKNYSSEYLNDLSDRLYELKENPGNAKYEWIRRQIVIQK